MRSLKINEILDHLQHELLVERVADLDQYFGLLVVVELPAPLVLDQVGGQHLGKAVLLDLLQVLFAPRLHI